MNNKEIFLKFITGQGTILVQNAREFMAFKSLLKSHGVLDILGRKPQAKQYYYWQELWQINSRHRGTPNLMVFEYQPGKGLSLYYDTKTPTNWYGEEPMVLAA